jgi:hypothetical protein
MRSVETVTCRPDFSGPDAAVDKAGDQRAGTKRALEQIALAHPLFQIIAQHRLGEEVRQGHRAIGDFLAEIGKAPDAEHSRWRRTPMAWRAPVPCGG